MTTTFFLILSSYLIGSIPTGILVARLKGATDPRTAGSGNIGATNVMRTAGSAAGACTLFLDILKGMAPVFAAENFFNVSASILSLTAFAVFFGHLFPIFLGFKGGKGVATGLGFFLILAPLQALIAVFLFVIVVITTRYVSLGSIIASLSIIVFLWFYSFPMQYIYLATAVSLLIILRHSDNIKRLLNGVENKIG